MNINDKNNKLMQQFGFNENTLAVNRMGILTEEQSLYMKEHSAGSIKAALVLIPLSILVVLIMAHYVFTKDGRSLNPIEVEIFLYGIAACVSLSVLWFLFNLKIWKKSRPYTAAGLAKHKIEEIYDSSSASLPSSKNYIYKVRIGSSTFILNTKDEMLTFIEGEKYKIYYMPLTGHKMILSAESID